MALDKFIDNVRAEVAKRFGLKTDAEIDAFFIGMEESARDNQEALEKRDKMLRDTIAELCEAKRLLKLAVEDLNNIGSCKTCVKFEDVCRGCRTDYKWVHEAEALALIGGSENE